MMLRKLALLALLPGLVWAKWPAGRNANQSSVKLLSSWKRKKHRKTVANFLSYVDDGSYNNSLFHRA